MQNMIEASANNTSSEGLVRVIGLIEETKSALAFMTEPIVCSGADMLCEFASIPGGAQTHATFFGQGGGTSNGAVSGKFLLLI